MITLAAIFLALSFPVKDLQRREKSRKVIPNPALDLTEMESRGYGAPPRWRSGHCQTAADTRDRGGRTQPHDPAATHTNTQTHTHQQSILSYSHTYLYMYSVVPRLVYPLFLHSMIWLKMKQNIHDLFKFWTYFPCAFYCLCMHPLS